MANQDLHTPLADEELTDRIVRLTDRITAYRQAGELESIPFAAADRQAMIDTLHARVLGQCPGCATTADGRWAHRLSCATPFAPGHAGWTIALDRRSAEVIVLD